MIFLNLITVTLIYSALKNIKCTAVDHAGEWDNTSQTSIMFLATMASDVP